jgi:hypothetical protein
LHGLAVEGNLAAVPLSDAHQDAKESRFACAVAAAEGVDAAGTQRKSAVTQRGNPGVCLGDLFSLEQ